MREKKIKMNYEFVLWHWTDKLIISLWDYPFLFPYCVAFFLPRERERDNFSLLNSNGILLNTHMYKTHVSAVS